MRGLFIAFFSFLIVGVNAQGINFQGVARGANGTIIAGGRVTLKLSILAKSSDGNVEYVETRTVITNPQGVFSVVLGDSALFASVGNFNNITWKEGRKYLKVEMDPAGGTNFLLMGTTALQNVPYAYYSLGVDAVNVNGILPVSKGGTGVSSVAELRTALGSDWAAKDSAVFGKDISVNGINVGKGNSSVSSNTSFGDGALKNNTTGFSNNAIGLNALNLNTTGYSNIAIGDNALAKNTEGILNTSVGVYALANNNGTGIYDAGNGITWPNGSGNTALGHRALTNNTIGSWNTALGNSALSSNTTAINNVAIGTMSLNANTVNGDNTGLGSYTLQQSTSYGNTAAGSHALQQNTTGGNNTAVGSYTMYLNTTGANNTAIGKDAMKDNVNFSNSTAIGYNAQVTANNQVQLGNANVTEVKTSGTMSAAGFKIPNGTAAQYLRADGTVTTSVTAGVPYTGASQAVNLGAYDLTVNGITIGVGAGNISATSNTVVGNSALRNNTSGSDNSAFGVNALMYNTTGTYNTAMGSSASVQNTTGSGNVSMGHFTLNANTTGGGNTAIGTGALRNNTIADYNTALGESASRNNTNGSRNTAIGANALYTNKSNVGSVAVGYSAMQYADDQTIGRNTGNTAVGFEALKGSSTPANNTGQFNTAVGFQSLISNTTGTQNSAFGSLALYSNTIGYNNIAIGQNALKNPNGNTYSNIAIGQNAMQSADNGVNNTIVIGDFSGGRISAQNNVVLGHYSLANNTTGMWNTALGMNTLTENILGNWNVAVGMYSLQKNLASNNTAVGDEAIQYNTTGENNSALGKQALYDNTLGSNNASIGMYSMHFNTTGSNNIAVGYQALQSNTVGSNNLAMGYNADATVNNLSYSTVIGAGATVSTSNTMVFGAQNNTTKWAFGRPTTNYALQVGNNTSDGNGAYLSTGGTWTNGSSIDFKEDFEELNGEEILNKIDNLSVTKWRYKGTSETHIGPIAEEFKTQFDLGVKGDDKHISTIDASGVALKAIQMLRKENIDLKNKISNLEKEVNKLKKYNSN